MTKSSYVGVVVIGRNEGNRLIRCLESIRGSSSTIVYVDSDSTDGSVMEARARGVDVVELSLAQPFTAGRARNSGFERICQSNSWVKYVQFVDGDCELDPDWLSFAEEFLDRNPDVAIVTGRRRERHPERSVYNQMCDYEWDTPVGIANACGGDFLVRADTYRAVGGFNASFIAGEEPEMCYRIREQGWQIYRAEQPMTVHDADMTRLSQWALRSSRSGYAYAATAALHREDAGSWYRIASNVVWSSALPLFVLGLAVFASPWALWLLLLYPLQWFRIKAKSRSGLEAFFLMLSKWTETFGHFLFLRRLIVGGKQAIIEYK